MSEIKLHCIKSYNGYVSEGEIYTAIRLTENQPTAQFYYSAVYKLASGSNDLNDVRVCSVPAYCFKEGVFHIAKLAVNHYKSQGGFIHDDNMDIAYNMVYAFSVDAIQYNNYIPNPFGEAEQDFIKSCHFEQNRDVM